MSLDGKIRAATCLVITDTDAVAHTGSRSAPRVAKVLGREIRAGVEHVWLDRLIHRDDECFDGWELTGAVSSVCRRVEAAPT